MKNTILHKGGESGVIKTVDFFITPGMQLLMASTSKNIGEVDLVSRGRRTVTSASLRQGLLTDDSVSFKVVSSTVLDININDTIGVFDQVYRINVLPSVRKVSNSSYEYDIVAQGLMFDMMRCKFFNTDATGFKTESEFPLIGNLELFLTVIANNMKRLSPLWSVGNFAAGGDTKTITFGDDNCLTALQKICQEFKTEFWIKHEAGEFKIHTGNFGSILPITLEYGKGKGLYSLTRNNVNDNDIITRLYVSGGTQNIPNGYKNFSRRLKLESGDYLEDTDLTNFFGLKEGSITSDEIYPKRTGTITALGDNKFKFEDSGMDFDLNEKDADGVTTKWLIPGTSAKVHFNKGNLAGYEFEIKKNGYDTAKKEFEIIPFKNESGQQFPDPDAAAFQFNVGDEYVLLDIVMPPSYVENAEAELLVKATEQFNLNKQAKVSYTLEVDPLFIKSLQTPIAVGDLIRVVDTPMGIDKVIRVTEITRDFITNGESTPYNFQLVIADDYEVSYASQMILEVQEIKNIVSITNLGQISYSKLGLKTTEELKNMIFDTDGYFDAENIKPNSIETNMLSVGSQSQQLSSSVVFILNKDGEVNKVEQKAGVLYSQTMDKTWTLTGQTITIPDNNARYVYGKCSKTSQTGSVLFTTEQIKFDENPNDYYFLIGVLHSVVEGVRVLSITIGTTTINGGLIRTGIISSLDGQTWFNLTTGEIKGKITFTADSPALQQIKVGGANLLRNSDFKQDISYWLPNGTGETISWSSAERAINIDNGGSAGAFFQHINVGAGDYVVSFDVKPYFQSGAAPYKVKVYLGDETRIVEIHSSTEYKRYKAVFSLTQPATTIVFQPMDADQRLYFKNLKLETGLIATDWTPAQADVDAAIYDAFQQGFQASHIITSLTNDNLLTPYEKTKVAEQWGNIVNEYPGIRDQAVSLSIIVDSFEKSYEDLEYYLYGTPGVIADMGSDSIIVGNDLRTAFANYYIEKNEVLLAISELLNIKVDLATASITDLENKTDFLSESTVAGNAIATGSLIVGNGEGANAGITGLGDADDVFLWGGKPFAQKDIAPITLTRDGFLKVRNGAGNVVFEIGQKAGKAVFDIYDDFGAKVAQIGASGIEFTGYIPESYAYTQLRTLTTGTVAAMKTQALSWTKVLMDLGNGTYKHYLQFPDTTTHQYSAGYNFESAMNQQYQGILFSSENKLGSTIPDGWYALYFEYLITQSPSRIVSVTLWRVVNGQILETQVASETVNWNQFIIM